jgi:hypothetical protein
MIGSMEIPRTRPNWRTGKYTVHVGDEIVGYFRQFRSAWLWRNYERVQHPNARILIYEHGTLVSVSEPGSRT